MANGNGERWNITAAPQWAQITVWAIQQLGISGVIALVLLAALLGLVPNPIMEKVVSNQNLLIAGVAEHSKNTDNFRPVLTRLFVDAVNRQNRILRVICIQGAKTEELKNQCGLFD